MTFLQACRCRKRRHGFKDAACPIGWSINASAKRKRKSRILRIDQRVALAFLPSIAWAPPGMGLRLQFNCAYCSMHLER